MQIKSVSFENYKAFAQKQTMQLRPVTILIGKNSSGKSSIAKLFTILENSLSGKIDEPLLLKNNGVELGGEFRDLVYNKQPNEIIKLSIEFEDHVRIEASLVQVNDQFRPIIKEWLYTDTKVSFLLEYVPQRETYIVNKGEEYKSGFSGILPSEYIEISDQMKLDDKKIDVDYIGPFRILPERIFHLTGQIIFRDTGATGENAYAMLGVSKLLESELYVKVGEWYKKNFDGWELTVDSGSRPYIQLLLSKNDTNINIVDVGQGMNQALPLVVRANVEGRDGSIVVIEQPELHLHPAAHGGLMELFAKSAKNNNQIFIIETHSENMLLRLRRLITENKDFPFTKDDVIIYWVENSDSHGQELREITIDEEGILSDWPDGVFNEGLEEILEMQKSINRKKV